MRPVVIIENDASLSAALRSTLEAAGFRTESYASATAALPELRRRSFSLAILGLDIVDTDPFAVCREASGVVPVITVASECGRGDLCTRALNCGADDCVPREMAGRELVARVRNVLRRTAGDGESPPEEEALSLSIAEMRVRRGEEVLDLTAGETELLALLLHHAPTPLTASRIAELLGARKATVDSRVKSLRRKLGRGRIANRGGFGYQLLLDGRN